MPGIDEQDLDILQPRRLYERTGRGDQYRAIVEQLKRERVEFLRGFEQLGDEIVGAVA